MIRWRGHLPFLRTLLLTLILVASALAGGRALAEDTLILTDGMKTGTLEGCASGVCSFDGAAVPRASIYYIGLDAEPPVPQPLDYTRDEVHLRDGSVHPGPLLTIDADNVVTGSASLLREDVAWIWLTPLTPGEEGQGEAEPSTTTSDGDGDGEAGTNEDRPTYLWEGTIRVENRYNDAKYGRHHWRAEYRIKFLETAYDPYPSSDSGRLISNNRVEPLELAYKYHADQTWQIWLRDDLMETVIMRGEATGHSRGDGSSNGLVLSSELWGLYEPWPDPYQAPSSFASLDEASHYADEHFAAPDPGWYYFAIEITGTEAERRAVYAGIERGGTSPAYNGPDRAILDVIPVCMPQPCWVKGRLDRPDQAEVQGGFSYPYRSGDDMSETPNEITVEWFFTRTRQ